MNWRAAAIQIIFMAICIPGLAHTIEPTITIPAGFQRIYDLNWFINTFGAIIAYWLLYKVFPDKHSLFSCTVAEIIDGESGCYEQGECGLETKRVEMKN
jgi:cytosine/uracil/thiamine/allantoin permease